MQENNIRDAYLGRQLYYERLGGDDYSAAQWAANATIKEFGITKEQLIEILNGK